MVPGSYTDTSWKVPSVADVNRDGQPDLLWQNIIDGHVAAWTFSMLVARGGYVIAPNWADPTWKMIR